MILPAAWAAQELALKAQHLGSQRPTEPPQRGWLDAPVEERAVGGQRERPMEIHGAGALSHGSLTAGTAGMLLNPGLT